MVYENNLEQYQHLKTKIEYNRNYQIAVYYEKLTKFRRNEQ